jgi:L-asparaginase
MTRKRIAVISTGGTIEKTYNEMAGVLHNQFSVLDVMIARLQLEGVELIRVPLMNKDSLELTTEHMTLIAQTAGNMAATHDGVVIVHGTDRLPETGDRCVEVLGTPPVPIVLTGAMIPYMMRNTDALQNLVEAFLAVQFLDPGIYATIHNKVLAFPGVRKDRTRGTFVKDDDQAV